MAAPWEKYRSGGQTVGAADPRIPLTMEKTRRDMSNDAERIAMERERLRQDQAAAELKRRLDMMEIDAQQRTKETNDPFNPAAMYEVRKDAAEKLQDIKTIRRNADEFGAVGSLLTPLLQKVPGTAAKTVSANVGTVQKAGALAKILEMTRLTGKNPFTPMSNSDVQLIAETQGALDPTLASDEFDRQTAKFEGAYLRALAGAGGNLSAIYPNDPNAREIDRQRRILDQRLQGKSSEEKRRAYGIFFGHPDITTRLPKVGRTQPAGKRKPANDGWKVERIGD